MPYNYYLDNPSIKLVDNERSYAIQLISDINSYLSNKRISIKVAGGESTINNNGRVKFPDVLLYADIDRIKVIQGWEIKCPDVDISDALFVEDARKKADLLGCNSTVLWNFKEAEIHIKNDKGDFYIARRWVIDERITTRENVATYRSSWVSFLSELLNVINDFYNTGIIEKRDMRDVLTSSVIPQIIYENKRHVALFLKTKSTEDISVNAYISNWYNNEGSEFCLDEQDAFMAYGKILIVDWLNKFLYGNYIKIYDSEARYVENITYGCKICEALDYFSYISNNCGFKILFTGHKYDQFIPEDTWSDLVTFNSLLKDSDFSSISADYAQKFLEESVSLLKREAEGQYSTPEPLSKLLCDLGIRDCAGSSWDCCCGTGTISCSMWERKYKILSEVFDDADKLAFDSVWMSDSNWYPLRIATLRYFSLKFTDRPLMIFSNNVFNIKPGQVIDLYDLKTGNSFQRELPMFSSIVSNLPYIDFNTNEVTRFEEVKERMRSFYKENFEIVLSDRCDLYCYLALFISNFLNSDGYVCLLTSNSWLCNEFGVGFLDALKVTYSIEGIYSNGVYRWFNNADIMNTIILLRHKSVKSDGAYFGVINASIENLDNENLRKSISDSLILHKENSNSIVSEDFLTWQKVDKSRELGLSLYSLCQGSIFLTSIVDCLIKLNSIFDISRGLKTGQDTFFYNDNPDFVDSKYIRRAQKNLRNVKTYLVTGDTYIFYCDDSEQQILENGDKKTLDYIKSNRRITSSCLKHRPYWYSLPENCEALFVTGMNPNDRLFFAEVDQTEAIVLNQRIICLNNKNEECDSDLFLALLNSTLGLLLLECSGSPMALGALDTRAYSVESMCMLNPDLISHDDRNRIVELFEPIKNREILSVLDELDQEDRILFDRAVLMSYRLEGLEDSIRSILKNMVKVRLGIHSDA